DYLGEAGVANTGYFDKEETKFPQFMQYPWFNAWCGDIDLCGNMKSQYLFRKVVFNDSKIEMLVHAPIPQGKKEHISYWGWPDEIKSWNWNGNEGKPLEVRAFSKCEEVDLYLNGKFIERKKISKEFKTKYTASFQVTYQPGNLKAVALQNGRTVDSTQIETTGKATAIRLKADRKSISASTNDLAYISVELIDEDGNVVLNEDRILHITQIGDAEITAGNANPTDTKSFRSLSPTTFRGRALIIVRPKGKTGAINLSVNGEKINSGEITISLH
ncbi:MAG: lacZ 20, partial [Bacteroidetes bacterium]|nr:lacZ 20 [Bacteroidota bacterium]